MGITRSNLHKRRATGGKRKIHRKKRKFELGRQSAHTKLGKTKVKLVRVRGGNYKVRGLRLNSGNFAWGSEGIAHKTRILDVVYNSSNNELVRTKTLVKGAIILIDATPFRQFYEARYAETLGKKKEDGVSLEKASERKKKKIEDRRAKRPEVDDLLRDQFPTGKLMARIASRPGQVGRSDGYILEGPELAFYLRKVQQKRSKK